MNEHSRNYSSNLPTFPSPRMYKSVFQVVQTKRSRNEIEYIDGSCSKNCQFVKSSIHHGVITQSYLGALAHNFS